MSTISVCLDPYEEKKCTWACSLCYPCMLELGSAGGNYLVYNMDPTKRGLSVNYGNEAYGEGKYAFLDGQGHGGDELLFFKKKPINLEKSEYNRSGYGYDHHDYIQFVDFDCRSMFSAIQYAQKTFNFDPEDSYEEWMIEKAQKLIKAWEKRYKMTVEEYYKTFFENRLAKVVAYRASREAAEKVASSTSIDFAEKLEGK